MLLLMLWAVFVVCVLQRKKCDVRWLAQVEKDIAQICDVIRPGETNNRLHRDIKKQKTKSSHGNF